MTGREARPRRSAIFQNVKIPTSGKIGQKWGTQLMLGTHFLLND